MFTLLFKPLLLVQEATIGAAQDAADEAGGLSGADIASEVMADPVGTAEKIKDWAIEFAPSLIGAILTYIIGMWVAKFLRGFLVKVMGKSKMDEALVRFLSNIAYYILVIMVVLAALGKLGVETTSFIAIIGAAGLAIGFALQGSLGNMAAGVMILLNRPFKLGDFVEVGGATGTIEDIGIFATIMKSPDNKKIIVPNAQVTGDAIVNYSANGTRRVDMVFGIGYGDDIDKARDIINGIIAADSRILKDPAPTVALSELGDSSVNFVCRPWVNGSDYWGVYFETHEAVKKAFDAQGVSIPFPQRDIHVFNETSA
jgi:small conductance mechanosensitive channel